MGIETVSLWVQRRPVKKPRNRLTRAMAQVCVNCPVCRGARRKPNGVAAKFVRTVETKICPFCRAYERFYGRKAHEPTWAC